jgi:aminopeptidase YwaD
MRRLIAACLLLSSCATTRLPITDDQLRENLKNHIAILASDEYEGRETGEPGALKAREYVVSQFELINLKPKGDKRYLQQFSFPKGATFGPSTQLYVNMSSYETGKDFYPLPYSRDSLVTGYVVKVGYGIDDPGLKQQDYLGKANLSKKIFLMESGTPDGSNPHGKFSDWTDLRKKIDVAVSKGAAGMRYSCDLRQRRCRQNAS